MNRPRLHPAFLALALAACGGLDGGQAGVKADASPVVATLASPDGQGRAQLQAGDAGAARASFEAALSADPNQLSALNDLAVGYSLDGRFDAARQLLEEVVARGGSREQQLALVNLGELYALDGYGTAAAAHLESARAIDPARPEPLYALALLADARGDLAQSRAALKDAVRADDGSARRALVFVYPEERAHLEALLAEARGDRAEAQARFQKLAAGRFPALAAAAQKHLEEP
ncbi:MAG TPA: tetratricopeptide repeat protein [Anaeromyxobacteraceae bacterium]|jgi:tetratricopeptide (TPR) repeat protein|nr:tetratricopeptide repeat protein [Anaeromyxobacteraceae bacterium]